MVPNFGEPEPLIRMPHMYKTAAEPALPGGNDGGGVCPRAVAGHQHLEIRIALSRERTQDGIEGVRPVVGSDDDGDQTDHGGAILQSRLKP